MSETTRYPAPGPPSRQQQQPQTNGGGGANLADILERVLDKGIVIAGDIQVNLLDIELLTIKIRLVVASVDRAKEMGIDWWERDPTLSAGHRELEDENRDLRARVEALERDRRELGDGREDLLDDEPADDESADDDLADDDLADDDLADDEPADDESTGDDLAEDEPAEDEPAEDEPAEDKPADDADRPRGRRARAVQPEDSDRNEAGTGESGRNGSDRGGTGRAPSETPRRRPAGARSSGSRRR